LRPSVHEAVTEPPLAQAASIADREAAMGSSSAFSEAPTSVPGEEEDEGPPSAPRLREAPEIEVSTEEDDAADEQVEERETLLKTPPPESGRQHVTPGPSIAVTGADAEEDDGSITVTMEESEVPPSVAPPTPEVSIPISAGRADDLPPRLALVSEPEIELHGMTPISAAILEPIAPAKPPLAPEPSAAKPPPTPKTPTSPEPLARKPEPYRPLAESAPPPEIELSLPAAPALPSATPSGVRTAAGHPSPAITQPAPPATTSPSVSASTALTPPAPPMITSPPVAAAASAPIPAAAPAAPPVRLMVQPLGDEGKPLPPVEVWASTFNSSLKGEVATFVHRNAEAGAKTFAELVRASVALGDDEP
jgi:hypothetical protein